MDNDKIEEPASRTSLTVDAPARLNPVDGVPVPRWLIALGILALLSPLIYVAWMLTVQASDTDYIKLVLGNYLVFFVLPYTAFFAYFLVATVEASRGPIEVEFAGFKFKGAGGPLLFWILIFLAISASIKMFWAGNLK